MLRICALSFVFLLSLSGCDRLQPPTEEPSLIPKPGLEMRILQLEPCTGCRLVAPPDRTDGTQQQPWYAGTLVVRAQDIRAIRKADRGSPSVDFEFNERIRGRIGRMTRDNVGKRAGWIVGGVLISNALIAGPFDKYMAIDFDTPEERHDFLFFATVEPKARY